MNNERIWTLIAKKLAGEATPEDLLELYDLLQENPEIHYSLEVFDELWQQNDFAKRRPIAAYARFLKKMEQQGIAFPPGERKPLNPPPVQRKKRSFPKLKLRPLMVRNNLKITWRNLARNKAYSIINITGLAIGMAASILILLWIYDELNFDKFHKNRDRIYDVLTRTEVNGKREAWFSTSSLLAPVLKANYPEVEEVTRINYVRAFMFHTGEKHIGGEGIIADPAFLKIFDYVLLQGDRNIALNDPRSLVVTESFAKKLFANTDVMGKLVRIDSNANFVITGVLKDIPHNSDLSFDYILPYSYNKEVQWDIPAWESTIIETIVMLKPGIDEKTANARFANIVKTHSKLNHELFLHPMNRWHLYSRIENGQSAPGRIKTVRLFGIIAGLILMIACINYMNLSTARSVRRAKEVGIRKVVGAEKSSLIGWFLGESIIISAIAGILALIIVQPNLGWFNQLTFKQLTIPFDNIYFWLGMAAFIFFTGIIAGSYPAFYLSAFKPIRVLKGTFKAAHTLVAPRKVLVVVQFTFAITLIICTIVIYRQIVYGQQRDRGYDNSNLAFVYIKGDLQKNFQPFRHDLLNSGAVTSLTRSNSPITDIWTGDDSYTWEGKDPNLFIGFYKYHTDKDFVKTMGMRLVDGRDIDPQKFPADSTAVLLNETAVKVMGFKDAVGKIVKSREAIWHVVGVVKDFLPENPFESPVPTIIQGPGEYRGFGVISFKLNDKKATSANLETIGHIYNKYNPDYPFEYYFTADQFAMKFLDENYTGSLAAIFAFLTIFISCLGLFALATYMAENRIKEIGVRKVLGASVTTITTLLSKDFLKLVLIAFVIASPLAWWMMNGWLQHYEYRVTIGWWVFAVTGLLCLVIALASVGYQSIKAALANPVRALRNE
jgi:ABC-type antimicrobial peptide transport system permease subunit